jgi:hypothetical protein
LFGVAMLTETKEQTAVEEKETGVGVASATLMSRQGNRLSASEFRFVAFFALALLLLSSIPYLCGHFLSFPNTRFNEHLSFDPDFNAYFGFMRQAQQGQWLLYNPFTPEPHAPVFFNLEWLLMGKLSALFQISLEASMQWVRVVSLFLLCGSFYWLASLLFPAVLMRRFVLAMAMLGGGFGWLLQIPGLDAPGRIGRFMDLYAGLHPFFWMIAQPHWLIVQGLALAAFCTFLLAERNGSVKLYVLSGALTTVVGAMRPWDIVYILLGIVFYMMAVTTLTWDSIRRHLPRLIVLLMPMPLLLYYQWLFKSHDLFRWYYIQNVGRGPEPTSLVLGGGAAMLVFLLSLGRLGNFSGKPAARILIPCCALSALALMYSHPLFGNTWQFHQTFLIPALLVAAMTIEPVVEALLKRTRWTYVGIAAFLAGNSLTSFALVKTFTAEVRRGEHRTGQGLLQAFEWLQTNSRPRDVVMANFEISNQIPRYTHNATFCGYAISTVAFDKKTAQVRQFYSSDTDDSFRKRLAAEYSIHYVIFGPNERNPGNFNPEQLGLSKKFDNGLIQIYEFPPA